MDGGAKKFSIALLLFGIVLSFFVAFNGDSINILISMLAYSLMALLLITIFSLKIPGYEFIYAALKPKDALIGAGVGGSFILLNTLNSAISLGAPQSLLSLGPTGMFIAIVLVAPVVEEFFFRGFVYPALYNGFGRRNWIAVPLSAAIFAIFHYAVYGGALGLYNSPGLFIGAFLFGVVAAMLNMEKPRFFNQETLSRSIVAHMIFNFYLLNLTAKFLSIGAVH